MRVECKNILTNGRGGPPISLGGDPNTFVASGIFRCRNGLAPPETEWFCECACKQIESPRSSAAAKLQPSKFDGAANFSCGGICGGGRLRSRIEVENCLLCGCKFFMFGGGCERSKTVMWAEGGGPVKIGAITCVDEIGKLVPVVRCDDDGFTWGNDAAGTVIVDCCPEVLGNWAERDLNAISFWTTWSMFNCVDADEEILIAEGSEDDTMFDTADCWILEVVYESAWTLCTWPLEICPMDVIDKVGGAIVFEIATRGIGGGIAVFGGGTV